MLKWIFVSCLFLNLYAIDCQKKLFNIYFDEKMSIEESLGELANYCSFSIVIQDKLAKQKLQKIQNNINIDQMSLKEIFKLFIEENNLNYIFDGKILKIYAIETKIFKINYITSIREGHSITKASVDSKPKQSEYDFTDDGKEENIIKTKEKFDFWKNIEKEIKALLDASSDEYIAKNPIVNPNAGLITLSATRLQIQKVQEYLQELKARLSKQVILDVNIIAVRLDKSHSNGINWQNFNINFISSNTQGENSFIQAQSGSGFVQNLGFKTQLDFVSIMNFLSQNGKTQVLSNPKLMALNNQQAIISVGDTINYQIKESSKGTENGSVVSESYNNYSIFVGILLNILPEISDDNKIMLRINPSLSDFKYTQDNKRQNIPRSIAPDTIQKKLSTVVQVDNNQTLILGGLISRNEIYQDNSVNFLSKLPIFGALFQSDEKLSNVSEIVFIIRPYIVKNQFTAPSLKDLGFSYHE